MSLRGYLDVDSTFFERHGSQMDVKTTLCAYSVRFHNILIKKKLLP